MVNFVDAYWLDSSHPGSKVEVLESSDNYKVQKCLDVGRVIKACWDSRKEGSITAIQISSILPKSLTTFRRIQEMKVTSRPFSLDFADLNLLWQLIPQYIRSMVLMMLLTRLVSIYNNYEAISKLLENSSTNKVVFEKTECC